MRDTINTPALFNKYTSEEKIQIFNLFGAIASEKSVAPIPEAEETKVVSSYIDSKTGETIEKTARTRFNVDEVTLAAVKAGDESEIERIESGIGYIDGVRGDITDSVISEAQNSANEKASEILKVAQSIYDPIKINDLIAELEALEEQTVSVKTAINTLEIRRDTIFVTEANGLNELQALRGKINSAVVPQLNDRIKAEQEKLRFSDDPIAIAA
ncbi:MAG: hypothetical protein Q9M91_06460 [Candidatus Dojkabacteria bacterium]|nr:hypothetical protein [Candidatus Dojkabacteria bacterium]MDQ7021438.1 hypothetical protein [Candidatus Dojkabacteria bacterium]